MYLHNMKLVNPTDFEILESLSNGKRNVAANLAHDLGKDRAYLNTRLPVLLDYGLVERIGPAPNSGLYKITPIGERAVQYRDHYSDQNTDFEDLII